MWGYNVTSSWSSTNYGTTRIICVTTQPDSKYYIVSFSNTSQIGTGVRHRHSLCDRARPGASRISHISTCITVGAGVLELCLPTLPASLSLFQATQFLPSALSSDPLHDRIGGVNWNSHTVRVSHFHLFIYLYKSDLPGPLIYSACMQICIVFALDQGRRGNVCFKVGIHLFDI